MTMLETKGSVPFHIEDRRVIRDDGRSVAKLLGDIRSKGVTIEPDLEERLLDVVTSDTFLVGSRFRTLFIAPVVYFVPQPKGVHPTTEEIYKGAEERGLAHMSDRTVFAYILQERTGLENGEELIMGTDPQLDSDGNPCILVFQRDENRLHLGDEMAGPDDVWEPDDWFVFEEPPIPSTK